jgi:hypothetical protein
MRRPVGVDMAQVQNGRVATDPKFRTVNPVRFVDVGRYEGIRRDMKGI